MKLKFKNQSFQEEAVAAVCDVFEGQPYRDPNKYTVDTGLINQTRSLIEEIGYCNAPITLPEETLRKNLRVVQYRQSLVHTDRLFEAYGLPELDVEMETGTGKTFVYLKTAFELNKRYGWSKFIVIVPGIAIREGVKKSIDIMAEKFQADYGKIAKAYVYNSARPKDVQDFSTDPDLQIMVMNVQAFNARGKDSRRIYMALDEFQSRKPIDLIAANRPILILDEPQKMEGKATKEMLPKFKPLMILRYSATHKTVHNLVYRLDAIDAFEKKLVKKIEPVCIDVSNRSGVYAYIYCAAIRPGKDAPEAVLEIQAKRKTGQIVTEMRTVRLRDDLAVISKGLTAYKDRYKVTELNAKDGYGMIAFENGLTLAPGQVSGDISELQLRRIQIREAVKAHLAKEAQLFDQGLKVLTLFFIDKVANYRVYGKDDDEGSKGEYAKIFEQEYVLEVNRRLGELLISPALRKYWESIAVEKTHAGYFSKDKKHKRFCDTKGTNEEDASTYDLILKNKERLLSFDEPVRFIFSHSALREGWDNPNVFVICPLKHPDAGNNVARRQEVGRGLRLCVNQDGERQDDPATVHDINVLTIVANEEFSQYVNGLQKEIIDACAARPLHADADFFNGKVLKRPVDDGKTETHTINMREAKALNKWLYYNDFIDDEDEIQPAWRDARESGAVPDLPEKLTELAPFKEQVCGLIDSVLNPAAVREYVAQQRTELKPNRNFHKVEFKELWSRINHKTAYTVEFSSEELIKKAICALDAQLDIPKLTYTVRRAQQTDGASFAADTHDTHEMPESYTENGMKYDLVGSVAAGTVLTRRTVCAILKGIKPHIFAQFRNNPEKFIAETIRIITEQKATMIVEHIQYHILEDTYSADIFTKNQFAVKTSGDTLKKHIYDQLRSDSQGELKFAQALDTSDEVVVYAKLPSGFAIPTPMGSYNPDWAIAFQQGKVKHLYFVAETKGSLSQMQLRAIEQAKIACAEKFFFALEEKDKKYHVAYKTVASYADLIAKAVGDTPSN